MRQVCLNERQEIVLAEVPAPTLSPGRALIRTTYSLISSGTELSTAQQAQSNTKNPIDVIGKIGTSLRREGLASTMARVRERLQPKPSLQGTGYLASGVILDIDDIPDLKVGDPVACGGASANHAEVISVPRNLIVRLPANVSLREACFTSMGAIAMQGLRRAQVSFGEIVVVTGLGLIGQLTCQLLQVAGCVVIGIDLSPARLRLAELSGATFTIDAKSESPVEAVRRVAGPNGVDAVLLCAATSSNDPINEAFEMCRERGRVVVVGDVGMGLERQTFYRKELDLAISRSYGPGRYDYQYEELGIDYPLGYVRWTENRNMEEFVRLLSAGKVNVERLISAEYRIDDAARAYQALKENSSENMGVLLGYNAENQAQSPTLKLSRSTRSKVSGKVRLAVIGAGNFARDYHLPNLTKFPNVDLAAIVSSTPVNARQMGEEFDAEYCTTDFHEVLADETIDAVVISTRHNLHAEISIAAAESGKHIFVEKPLALTVADCEKVCRAVAESKVLLTVGFNRRFAPLITELKELLDNIPGPRMITYRVNAGALPPDHWTLDPEVGGGRILGEACHFFDLLYYLIGTEPRRISALQARPEIGKVVDPANMSITLEFADGSVGTLVYTVIGHREMSKERLEAFAGGKSFVMDNFQVLETYGQKRTKAPSQTNDKGHKQLLEHFCNAVAGKNDLAISARDGLRATLCGLKALESANAGTIVSVTPEELYA